MMVVEDIVQEKQLISLWMVNLITNSGIKVWLCTSTKVEQESQNFEKKNDYFDS